jgi:hypothetical protein
LPVNVTHVGLVKVPCAEPLIVPSPISRPRPREFWPVRRGTSQARSTNLDVALTRAIRAEKEVVAHAHEVDYPTWIRNVADALGPDD